MKNKAAQEMARLRVKSQTPQERKDSARKAVNARWAKYRQSRSRKAGKGGKNG